MDAKIKELDKVVDFWSCRNCSSDIDCLTGLLNDDEVKLVKDAIRCHQPIPSNTRLFREGSPFQGLYIVKSGCVKLQTTSKTGEIHIRGFYFPGDILGIDSIDNRFYQYDAISVVETRACQLSFEKLSELTLKIPALKKKLFDKIASEIKHNQEEHLFKLSHHDAENKIKLFIISISRKIGVKQPDGTIKIDLPMSMSEIAAFLGMRTETLSRSLKKLTIKGFVKAKEHHSIIIPEIPDELEKVSNLFESG